MHFVAWHVVKYRGGTDSRLFLLSLVGTFTFPSSGLMAAALAARGFVFVFV